jgi:hypothetical protein
MMAASLIGMGLASIGAAGVEHFTGANLAGAWSVDRRLGEVVDTRGYPDYIDTRVAATHAPTFMPTSGKRVANSLCNNGDGCNMDTHAFCGHTDGTGVMVFSCLCKPGYIPEPRAMATSCTDVGVLTQVPTSAPTTQPTLNVSAYEALASPTNPGPNYTSYPSDVPTAVPTMTNHPTMVIPTNYPTAYVDSTSDSKKVALEVALEAEEIAGIAICVTLIVVLLVGYFVKKGKAADNPLTPQGEASGL